ncbi:MAG TPA: hypothetical protein VEX38_09265, partial [Fimbriimonadaceae bacterium]|nr:hypothetical protein [Fimbriimonadaceae bacterium]
MNARIKYLILLPALLIMAACGGGGGGSVGGADTARLVGRVLNVETGAALNPAASVQVGNASTLTSTQDGSFGLSAPAGSTNVVVDTRNAFGTWNFTIPPLTGTLDAGDLWVGPQRVTLRGRVLDASNNQPIANAVVSFAGRTGRTTADGRFALAEVAYSNATQTAFWGIRGSVTANSYFRTDFSAQPNTAVNGSVTVNDILLTPTSD